MVQTIISSDQIQAVGSTKPVPLAVYLHNLRERVPFDLHYPLMLNDTEIAYPVQPIVISPKCLCGEEDEDKAYRMIMSISHMYIFLV